MTGGVESLQPELNDPRPQPSKHKRPEKRLVVNFLTNYPRGGGVEADLFWPTLLRAPAMPVTLVCGPPASGKSSYVTANAGASDVVIDVDEIAREISGSARNPSRDIRYKALAERNRRLAELADNFEARAAWFVTTSAAGLLRERWARLLRAQRVLLILTPRSVCMDRMIRDPERRLHIKMQTDILDKWWRNYYPSELDSIVRA